MTGGVPLDGCGAGELAGAAERGQLALRAERLPGFARSRRGGVPARPRERPPRGARIRDRDRARLPIRARTARDPNGPLPRRRKVGYAGPDPIVRPHAVGGPASGNSDSGSVGPPVRRASYLRLAGTPWADCGPDFRRGRVGTPPLDRRRRGDDPMAMEISPRTSAALVGNSSPAPRDRSGADASATDPRRGGARS
jgi:hypothetical protein